MEEKTSISFANVATRYDGSAEILSDVSFNIGSGGFYFLSGASGAGKTTLLRLIYQLHKPTRGQIKLFGKSTEGLSRDEITKLRQKMAIVFQEYSLLSHLTVFDNVALPLRVRGLSESKIRPLVSKVLDWVGLGKFGDALPRTLSGGQQQRVSVARAIIVQPSILLADEPTGSLDDENASRLMELFIQMNKMFGTTIILATHNKKLMETYKFPVINVENHRVTFVGQKPVATEPTESKKVWKGPKPQTYFAELSKQFDDIGNA
ncbi:MAG: ATP-binding cassette domain-containing protein [Alphaproteobacteria bacterium]|nr:ATP-binding cassette domain-containing protein [Alphaproteobacteria bacterium]MBR5575312.1 ATP-binding cassette domain-containing protein [Alphaproteobacteria bacterium]